MSAISTDAAINGVIAAQQGQTQTRIAYAVAAESQDAQRAAGDAALRLLESAGRVGRAEGRGGRFDAAG